nr:peptidoglycan-binding domain-containing protein [Fictibacillus sp. WQ 8-8]
MDLMLAGEKLPKFGAEGKPGDETTAAIKSFQKKNKLVIDSIPGPKTLAKLAEVLKKKKVTTNPLPKPKVTPKPKKPIHRLIADGKQVNAFGETDNLLASIEKQIKAGVKKLKLRGCNND